ncbi:hypothetical protein NLU13_2626 [Sarocladium strictum]|uniref:Uncharacterized protein n=1 Tax=Sarocladium strictum TaxID=5046 RepID=A0AA39GKH8_SARSR|nr:hypothetical protein NLU13_2626 [Sarocladium strictum]
MDSQAPPLHYPNSHESTAEVYRTRQDDLYSPTLVNGGYPLPAYGEEPEPPQYQETPEELAKAKKRARNILVVRLLTSVFIALIVSLIVAGAVTKIQQGKTQDRSEETKDSIETMMGDTRITADMDMYESRTQNTATAAEAEATATGDDYMLFDCDCWSEVPAAPTPTSGVQCETKSSDGDKKTDEFFLMGVSRYTSPDCRLARASFKGTNDDVRYRCMLSCIDPELGEGSVEEIMAGHWKPDLEE